MVAAYWFREWLTVFQDVAASLVIRSKRCNSFREVGRALGRRTPVRQQSACKGHRGLYLHGVTPADLSAQR